MYTKIIGIDCATRWNNVGLALGIWENSHLHLEDALQPVGPEGLIHRVGQWISSAPRSRVLLALDAPLGWPIAMAKALPDHMAGQPVKAEANSLFMRETDLFVRETIRKKALEVGANLIARTARWALSFLGELRHETGEEIPLAWSPSDMPRVTAVEVYPAATYLGYGIKLKRYSRPSDREARISLGLALSVHMIVGDLMEKFVQSPHILDAAACTLAGADFLQGKAWKPQNKETAIKEGWIWFKSSGSA